MQKYIITEEQLNRIARVNMLLAREIRSNTFYQSVDDSVALAVHLDNLGKELTENPIPNYELKATGGKFVWVPDKK